LFRHPVPPVRVCGPACATGCSLGAEYTAWIGGTGERRDGEGRAATETPPVPPGFATATWETRRRPGRRSVDSVDAPSTGSPEFLRSLRTVYEVYRIFTGSIDRLRSLRIVYRVSRPFTKSTGRPPSLQTVYGVSRIFTESTGRLRGLQNFYRVYKLSTESTDRLPGLQSVYGRAPPACRSIPARGDFRPGGPQGCSQGLQPLVGWSPPPHQSPGGTPGAVSAKTRRRPPGRREVLVLTGPCSRRGDPFGSLRPSGPEARLRPKVLLISQGASRNRARAGAPRPPRRQPPLPPGGRHPLRLDRHPPLRQTRRRHGHPHRQALLEPPPAAGRPPRGGAGCQGARRR
jgi:hypothetical protein